MDSTHPRNVYDNICKYDGFGIIEQECLLDIVRFERHADEGYLQIDCCAERTQATHETVLNTQVIFL